MVSMRGRADTPAKGRRGSPEGSVRLIGLERQYRCDGCGHEHRSWSRLRECPDCGQRFFFATILRAAFAG
jgi:DNA-directed RNA polymerase subunit RPC12/RpoP